MKPELLRLTANGLLLTAALLIWCFPAARAADRVIIGNISRTIEQLPNYAATDKGFFPQEGIQGDVVLIGSTDTLVQALIAGQVNVAIVDPSAAINAIERGAALKIIGGTVPGFFHERWGWAGVFYFLAGMVFLAGLILLPWWNAMPPTAKGGFNAVEERDGGEE